MNERSDSFWVHSSRFAQIHLRSSNWTVHWAHRHFRTASSILLLTSSNAKVYGWIEYDGWYNRKCHQKRRAPNIEFLLNVGCSTCYHMKRWHFIGPSLIYCFIHSLLSTFNSDKAKQSGAEQPKNWTINNKLGSILASFSRHNQLIEMVITVKRVHLNHSIQTHELITLQSLYCNKPDKIMTNVSLIQPFEFDFLLCRNSAR